MGGLLKGLLRLILLGWFAAWIGAVIGALVVRRHTVVRDEAGADEVVLAAIFGQLDFTSTASAFRGGRVECWFGGGVLDLRSATLDPLGADLTVRAVFGGGQILVPESWRVGLLTQGFGGAVDSRTSGDVDLEGPELRIDCTVLFGGFQVVAQAPGDVAAWRGVEVA